MKYVNTEKLSDYNLHNVMFVKLLSYKVEKPYKSSTLLGLNK